MSVCRSRYGVENGDGLRDVEDGRLSQERHVARQRALFRVRIWLHCPKIEWVSLRRGGEKKSRLFLLPKKDAQDILPFLSLSFPAATVSSAAAPLMRHLRSTLSGPDRAWEIPNGFPATENDALTLYQVTNSLDAVSPRRKKEKKKIGHMISKSKWTFFQPNILDNKMDELGSTYMPCSPSQCAGCPGSMPWTDDAPL